MNLNVRFIDSLVRRYFSLHHTMNVESVVCSVMMESLKSLENLIEEKKCDTENSPSPALPNLETLFTSADIQKTLEEGCLGPLFSVPDERISNMAEYMLRQGIIRLLERLEKPYVVATAKGFGMSKSALSKLPHSDLILFIARVALDSEFYAEPQEVETLLTDSVPATPKRAEKTEKALTPQSIPSERKFAKSESPKVSKTPRSKVETKKAQKPHEVKRKRLRLNLFADEPLSQKGKKGKPSQSPSKSNTSSQNRMLASPAKRTVIEPPAEIDISTLENACQGHRDIPLSWLRDTDPRTAWMMLFNTSNVATEELRKYRIPIGPKSSAWQLQQWFFSGELQKYCTDYKLPLKGKKKSFVISGILKHVNNDRPNTKIPPTEVSLTMPPENPTI